MLELPDTFLSPSLLPDHQYREVKGRRRQTKDNVNLASWLGLGVKNIKFLL